MMKVNMTEGCMQSKDMIHDPNSFQPSLIIVKVATGDEVDGRSPNKLL